MFSVTSDSTLQGHHFRGLSFAAPVVKSDSGVVSKPTALTPILCQRYTKVGWDTLSSVDLKVPARVWSVPAPQHCRVRHREAMAGIICRSPWVILVCAPPGEGQLAPFCLC